MSIERESKKRSEKFDRVQTTIEKAKNQPKYKLHLLRIQINWNKVNSKENIKEPTGINEVWIERNSQKNSAKFDKTQLEEKTKQRSKVLVESQSNNRDECYWKRISEIQSNSMKNQMRKSRIKTKTKII